MSVCWAVPVSTHSQLEQLRVEVLGAVNGTQQLKNWVEQVKVSGWVEVAAVYSTRVDCVW